MCIPSIRTRNPLLGWLLIIIVCTLSGILRIVKHSIWYFENCKVYGLPSGGLKQGELPLCTELPVRILLGNPHSYTRIPVRYRGVGKRACSPGFLEEFFSETQFPAFGALGTCSLLAGSFYLLQYQLERSRVYPQLSPKRAVERNDRKYGEGDASRQRRYRYHVQPSALHPQEVGEKDYGHR